MKPGDFVRLRGSSPPRYARIVHAETSHIEVKTLDGWQQSVMPEKIAPADLADVWQAIEVEQSRIDRRLADLNATRALAFERALKAGR